MYYYTPYTYALTKKAFPHDAFGLSSCCIQIAKASNLYLELTGILHVFSL